MSSSRRDHRAGTLRDRGEINEPGNPELDSRNREEEMVPGMKSVVILTSLSSGSFNSPRDKACQHKAEEQEDAADPTPQGTEGLRAGVQLELVCYSKVKHEKSKSQVQNSFRVSHTNNDNCAVLCLCRCTQAHVCACRQSAEGRFRCPVSGLLASSMST